MCVWLDIIRSLMSFVRRPSYLSNKFRMFSYYLIFLSFLLWFISRIGYLSMLIQQSERLQTYNTPRKHEFVWILLKLKVIIVFMVVRNEHMCATKYPIFTLFNKNKSRYSYASQINNAFYVWLRYRCNSSPVPLSTDTNKTCHKNRYITSTIPSSINHFIVTNKSEKMYSQNFETAISETIYATWLRFNMHVARRADSFKRSVYKVWNGASR